MIEDDSLLDQPAPDDETLGDEASQEQSAAQRKRVKASSLLWFISSRSYVPMADLRRRFNLPTVTGSILWDDEGPVHIGLPRQAAETLIDLKKKKRIGLEYDLEHATRIAVGTYPMHIRITSPAAPLREARRSSDAVTSMASLPSESHDQHDEGREVIEVVPMEEHIEMVAELAIVTVEPAAPRSRRRRRR